MPLALAGITLLGTIVSAGFAALSGWAGTQAAQEVNAIKEQFNRQSTFSQRLESALTNLVIDKDKSRMQSDKAATEVFSLFAIAQGREEKRSLLYVALSSRSEDLEELISEFLGNSTDPDDQTLAKEFRLEEIALQVQDNANAVPGQDTLPASNAPSTIVISNVTLYGASGWAYLGTAEAVSNGRATQPGTPHSPAPTAQLRMEQSYVVPATLPKANDIVVFNRYVHLRDASLPPTVGRLPDITGIITKGQSVRVEEVITLPLREDVAVWAKVYLCPDSNCPR